MTDAYSSLGFLASPVVPNLGVAALWGAVYNTQGFTILIYNTIL